MIKFRRLLVTVLTIVSIAVLSFSFGTTASAIRTDIWDYEVIDGEAEITGWIGWISSLKIAEIPEEIDGYTVTGINANAFDWESFSTVIIPDSVRYIGSQAFYECNNLETVVLGNGIEVIDEDAFNSCDSIKRVVIPESVTYIGRDAFSYCNLLEVIFYEGTESEWETICDEYYGDYDIYFNIDEDYFLTDNTLFNPNQTMLVRYTAEDECYFAPETVKTIEENAFRNADQLKSVYLPNGLKNIGPYAFADAINLEYIYIPDTVNTIDESAFSGCENLSVVDYAGSKMQWNMITLGADNSFLENADICFDRELTAEDGVVYTADKKTLVAYKSDKMIKAFTVPESVEIIDSEAFKNTALEEIIMPSGLKEIGISAFENCDSLKRAEFYDGLVFVSMNAFKDCDTLAEVVLPDSVEIIAEYAFFNCSDLCSVNFPESLSALGAYAFSGCSSLDNIVLSEGLLEIQSFAFSGCSSLSEITVPEQITKISANLFSDCTSLVTVVLPEGLQAIGKNAFSGCNLLIEINFPETLISVEDSAFKNCSSLSYVSLPDNVSELGSDVFMNCTAIETFCLSEGELSEIPDNAFKGCSKLNKLYIPANITEFGDSAFYGCNKLYDIYFGGTEADWNAFEIVSSNSVIWAADVHYGHEHIITEWTEIYPVEKYKDGLETGACDICEYRDMHIIPCGHKHLYDYVVTTPATCIEKGLGTYTCECTDSYTEVIPALGHTEEIISGIPPICTDTGISDGKKCLVCGEILVAQEEIPATGHTEKVIHGKPVTCTENGVSDGKKCSVCGEILVAQEVIFAKGHTAGNWVVVKKAEIGKKGLEQQKCTVCGVVMNERDIPALPEVVKNKIGDANGDGKITAADARITLRISAKLEKIENYKLPLSVFDATGDNKITAADARKILRVSAKLETM